MITKKCQQCRKEIKVKPCHKDNNNYCSRECYYISKKGKVSWNKGIPMKESSKKLLSDKKKGKNYSPLTQFVKGIIPWNKGIKQLATTGDKNHNWKGGITTENEKQRKSVEYKLWRTSVFERDNYTCVMCGAKNGNGKAITLNADHIKPFSLFPELRFAIDNGRTLCIDCHKKTDSYMTNIRKLEKLYLDK